MPVSCLLFAFVSHEAFLLMAGVREAKLILQYLMTSLQILRSLRSAANPFISALPSLSEHAFNHLPRTEEQLSRSVNENNKKTKAVHPLAGADSSTYRNRCL